MECALCISPLVLQAYGIVFTSYVVQYTLPFAMQLIILNIWYAYEQNFSLYSNIFIIFVIVIVLYCLSFTYLIDDLFIFLHFLRWDMM